MCSETSQYAQSLTIRARMYSTPNYTGFIVISTEYLFQKSPRRATNSVARERASTARQPKSQLLFIQFCAPQVSKVLRPCRFSIQILLLQNIRLFASLRCQI